MGIKSNVAFFRPFWIKRKSPYPSGQQYFRIIAHIDEWWVGSDRTGRITWIQMLEAIEDFKVIRWWQW